MKIVILSIAVCTFLADQASSDGGNIYGSNPVQYSHPQPINYHYPQPQPHYGSQQGYNNPAGYHPAQHPQHQGHNQFSEQYVVTAIKTEPAPPVVHYQPPSYKPESPFNGQSYIIEPSYVLKPFRPETTYHAQAYRPHNPPPAVYQPTYHAPSYPAYQPPSYQAPVYQPPAYQQQIYPAPAYQNPAQSSVFLVYSTPVLAEYSTQGPNSRPVTSSIEPSATQTYAATASATPESFSSSKVQQAAIVEPTVKWSDILSSDANELGQKYVAENGDRSTDKESAENEKNGSAEITKSYNSETPKKEKEVEQNSSESPNQPSYPIPANLTSKAVWKIPQTAGTTPDSSTEDGGDTSDGHKEPNQKGTIYSNKAEIEESSKSSLTDKANKVGSENKESSEITSVDQVTKISLQGELTNYNGRNPQAPTISTSKETSAINIEAAVVELVSQVSLQHEKPRSGSSVYYEQGPGIAGQDVNETKTSGESKQPSRDQPESSEQEKEQNGEINSEEVGTEATLVSSANKVNEPKNTYSDANAEKPDVSIQVKETVDQKKVSQYGQPQRLVQKQEGDADESNETTEVSISKAESVAHQPLVYPQDPANPAPPAALVDNDESDEVPNVVTPAVTTIQPTTSAYQIPNYPPRPIVPKLFRPKEESEEVELPTAGFGEKIKAFTKLAIAFQKVTQQSINQTYPVTGKEESSSISPVSNNSEEVTQIEAKQPESVSAENYATKATDKAINIQPAIEYAYPTEGPTFHASLFYRKPIPQEDYAPGSELIVPTTTIASPREEEIKTEIPYNPKPLFYAQAAEKLTASHLAYGPNGRIAQTGQDVSFEKVEPVKEDYVPVGSTKPNYGVRIVAEKMSRDQPVQVVNAEPIVQMPVLAHDPMEKTDFYATQRIYTASAESPGDYATTSTPISYVQDQNPYVTSTYAYIEEAGLSAEYQKEIAAAQKEAQSLPNSHQTLDESQTRTEIPDVSQEEVPFPSVTTPILTGAYGDALIKAISVEDVSSEVTSVPDTEPAYQEKTEYREVETVTSRAKPSEEVSSEIAYAPVTQSTYQEKSRTVSYEAELVTIKVQSAEDVSFEVTDASVTDLAYQEKTKIPSYEVPAVTTVKVQSAEDVSLEVLDPVTDSNYQNEATDLPDIPWARYETPVVKQELVPAVTAPYDTAPSYTTPDPETTSFVVGTILQVDSRESSEVVTPSKSDEPKTSPRFYNTTGAKTAERPPPCHADKSSEVVHSPKFLFNTAALANVPLDSSESSGEDATLAPTTGIPEATTTSAASNESAEVTTTSADGYKYIFKSRPTPNRFYEAKTTTAIPSINSTSTAQPIPRRPLVVIGKPVEIRKPINGRVYSRPSSVSQRKPQTLAQIKILPTRLRSSTSTIQLPNRRFFIGRSLMASEKGNRESKEDDEGKAK